MPDTDNRWRVSSVCRATGCDVDPDTPFFLAVTRPAGSIVQIPMTATALANLLAAGAQALAVHVRSADQDAVRRVGDA